MSRNGRFRKQMIDQDKLPLEARSLSRAFVRLKELEISDPDKVSAALLIWSDLRQKNYALCGLNQKEISTNSSQISSKNAHEISSEDLETVLKEINYELTNEKNRAKTSGLTFYDIATGFTFRSVPVAVNRALQGWYHKNMNLNLFFHIPTPLEVLEMQLGSSRCVTLLTSESELSSFVMGERDPFGFLLHDLIHADKFFSNPTQMQGQLLFYHWIKQELAKGKLKPLYQLLQTDEAPHWVEDFEYLIADMNSHPQHLFQYLEAMFFKNNLESLDINFTDLQMSWLAYYHQSTNHHDVTSAQL